MFFVCKGLEHAWKKKNIQPSTHQSPQPTKAEFVSPVIMLYSEHPLECILTCE